MGGRGVGSYSYNRKVQLANKIATINKKLAKIEEKATKEAQNEKKERYKSYRKWNSKESSWATAKEEANWVKGHSMAEQGAGKLQQQKKQYTKELAKLNAGQMRMFR